MTKRMLIDATHPEETRVAVVSGNRLEEFEYEAANRQQLKGNIYLAKVTRVEPSLQASFVEYGGNRHGFLAFTEIHPDYYRLPLADRQALVAEVEAQRGLDDDDGERTSTGGESKRGSSRGGRRRKPARRQRPGSTVSAEADSEAGQDAGDGGADDRPARVAVPETMVAVPRAEGRPGEPAELAAEGPVADPHGWSSLVPELTADDIDPFAPWRDDDDDDDSFDAQAAVPNWEDFAADADDEEPDAPESRVGHAGPQWFDDDEDEEDDSPNEAGAEPDDEDGATRDSASETSTDGVDDDERSVSAESNDPADPDDRPDRLDSAGGFSPGPDWQAEDDGQNAEPLDPFQTDMRDDWETFPTGGRTKGQAEGDGDPPPGDPPTRRVRRSRRAAPLAAESGAVVTRDEPLPAPINGDIETVGGDSPEDLEPRRPSRPLRNYKIQEVIKRRQIMLVQVSKEERGNKGAALTTYLSLAGRYCVLMPNTARGGGVSRKIANPKDRKRMKTILEDLRVPEGMAVILRTAGLERTKAEIRRDFEYLLRLWDSIREITLASTAPCVIHEEANLIKRAIRDLYSKDIDEVLVAGDEGYRTAKDFMKMLMPSHAKKVQHYRDGVPLFYRYRVESQIDLLHSPVLTLRSGGYIVINPTEALVAIDVNSGKSTRERNIEETAYKTNLEAAEEVARQLRLRDLAGLIVIDFIDMEDDRHNLAVERRLKEAMRVDRARIQLGRISPFGLLELSRQRLRPSFAETHFEMCPHCEGLGLVRTMGSAALHVLRAVEEEGLSQRASEVAVYVPADIALYIFNQKREALAEIEERYGFRVQLARDDTLMSPNYRMELIRGRSEEDAQEAPINTARLMADAEAALAAEESESQAGQAADAADSEDRGARKTRRSRRPSSRRKEDEAAPTEADETEEAVEAASDAEADGDFDGDESGTDADGDDRPRKKRRRGKRGGRRRSTQKSEGGDFEDQDGSDSEDQADTEDSIEGDGPDTGTPADDSAGPLPLAADGTSSETGAETGMAEFGSVESNAETGETVETGESDLFTVVATSDGDSVVLPPWESPDEGTPATPVPEAQANADDGNANDTGASGEAPDEVATAPVAPEGEDQQQPIERPIDEDSPGLPLTQEAADDLLRPVEAIIPEPAPGSEAAPIDRPLETVGEDRGGEHDYEPEEGNGSPRVADYETVNQPPDKPRRGWWQRLIDG